MENSFAALDALMEQGALPPSSFCIAEVTRVAQPLPDGRGELLEAALGELPLAPDDLTFLTHAKGVCAVGERLFLMPSADEQHFYCVGRL